MKVISAGFGRTGTASIKAALETLTGAPCYHFEELFKNTEHREAWVRFVTGEETMDWEALFAEYEATADFPACAYYEEIAEIYPDALILLSTRDLESWAASWNTLWRLFAVFKIPALGWVFPWVKGITTVLNEAVVARVFGGDMSRANMIEVHRAHIERVKATVPAERLLVFKVQDGWEPLCEALGVPVPDEPFPHSNSGAWPFVRRGLRKMAGGRWKNLSEG